MRQAMLMLAITIGSPLAMAQGAAGTGTPAKAPQQVPAELATSDSPARKPLSPIGRALADLLGAANLQRAQVDAEAPRAAGVAPSAAMPRRGTDSTIHANAIDAGAASRARLAAETEHGGVP